ncbi:MAG: heterodisulfide reductase-related iron-sulfur binding cluster [Candidatus Brocadiia bacterium]
MLEAIIITLCLVLGFGLSIFFFVRKLSYLEIGAPSDRFGDYCKRLGIFLKRVIAQYYLFRKPIPGMFHALVFWGFCAFAVASLNHIVEGYGGLEATIFPGIMKNYYFAFLDIVALLTLVSILGLAVRRYVFRPKCLTHPSNESAIIIFFIFLLMVTYFLGQAFKFNLVGNFSEAKYMLISGNLASFVPGCGIDPMTGYKFNWWLHLAVLLSFAVFIPNSKHMHLVVCPINEFFSDLGPRGVQEKIEINLEADELPPLGKSRIEQFKVHDLLDLYAYVECGRCQDVCPANISGKNLSPKQVILDMKEHFLHEAPRLLAAKKAGKNTAEIERPALVGDVITEDRIWDCTSCYACQEMCPVGNEHPQKLLEMRRHITMEKEKPPAEAATMFRNVENQANPWGLSRSERGSFLSDLNVPKCSDGVEFEYLLWIGCSGSYDQRAQKTVRALVQILKKANVKFAILGPEEGCCGDPARRLGNELLFQMSAQENIEVMKNYGVKKIITACPHGYRILAHEYRQFGGEYEVEHYTTFVRRLISEGRLNLVAKSGAKVTYHDSCYLGRWSGIYDEPRELLKATGAKIVEMDRNRDWSFCCGGGGGRMFLEEDRGERINRLRTDMAAATGASTIAVACPFCLTMLEDGIKERGLEDKLKAAEICEIILESTAGEK